MVKKLFPIFLILTLFLSFGCKGKKSNPTAPASSGGSNNSGGGDIDPDVDPDVDPEDEPEDEPEEPEVLPPSPIQLVYRTEGPGEVIYSHTLTGTEDCYIDWGDESEAESCVEEDYLEHGYAEAGEYVVQIHGVVGHLNPEMIPDGSPLIKVLDIGRTGLTSLEGSFSGMNSLSHFSIGSGDTSGVASMKGMFSSSGDELSLTMDFDGVNTSNVTTMEDMFRGLSGAVSLDLRSFDLSYVSNFRKMFSRANDLTLIDLRGSSPKGGVIAPQVFENISPTIYCDDGEIFGETCSDP